MIEFPYLVSSVTVDISVLCALVSAGSSKVHVSVSLLYEISDSAIEKVLDPSSLRTHVTGLFFDNRCLLSPRLSSLSAGGLDGLSDQTDRGRLTGTDLVPTLLAFLLLLRTILSNFRCAEYLSQNTLCLTAIILIPDNSANMLLVDWRKSFWKPYAKALRSTASQNMLQGTGWTIYIQKK